MAQRYRLTPWRRLVNAAIRPLVLLGIAPRRYVLLTVRGRRSGQPHSTPVILLSRDGERFLVSPYGETAWVRNARAAGEVTVSRAGRSETVAVEELSAEEAAPILKQYLAETPITRPFFDVAPDVPLAEFVREAPRHPVFRLHESGL